MFNKRRMAQPGQPENKAPVNWPQEDSGAAWQRVLDCGAPGPGRETPILFYQDGRCPADADEGGDPEEEAENARAS